MARIGAAGIITRIKELRGDSILITDTLGLETVCDRITVMCTTCLTHWTPMVRMLLYSKSGCPECFGRKKVDLPRFLKKANFFNGERLDYSLNTRVEYSGNVLVKCKICGHIWKGRTSTHYSKEVSCPGCRSLNKKKIQSCKTLKEFITRATEIHGDRYSYHQVTALTKVVLIQCKRCKHQIKATPKDHLKRSFACTFCF